MIAQPPGTTFSDPADRAEQSDDSALTEWERLLSVADDEEFLAAALRYVVSTLGGQAGALLTLNADRKGASILVSLSSPGIPSQLFTAPETQQASVHTLRHRQRNVLELKGMPDLQLLLLPVQGPKGEPLALGILLMRGASYQLDSRTMLNLAVQVFDQRQQNTQGAQLESGFTRATALLEVFNRAGLAPDFGLAVTTMAAELKALIGCDRLAIGSGNQDRCKVEALSGASHHDIRSQTATLLNRAMREAIGVSRTTVWPMPEKLPDQVLSAGNLDRLLDATGMRLALTLPLTTEDGEVTGAICCLWKDNTPAALRQWELTHAITPHLAAVLGLLQAAKPRGLRAAFQKVWPKKGFLKRATLVGFPFLFAAAMFLPAPHRITADCQLQPKIKRQVAAPFNGVLEKPHVKPGEFVQEGQLLATLDGKEIGLTLAETTFKHQATLKLRDQAMAKDDVSTTLLEQLNSEALALEIDLLKSRQENLQIRSPMEGLILSGNLEQSEGVPVSEGQQLFEIAPIHELVVEVAVSDSDISFVEPGMEVSLRLESQLGYNYSSTLEVVHPISEIQDEHNVFICQTTIPNADGELRPGMGGKARIKSGSKRLGWVLFHKPWNFIRMRFW